MYKEFIGQQVTVLVATRGDNVLEYTGTISDESNETLTMTNTDIGYLLLNFQKGFFGNNIGKYKENVSKIVINKRHILSCNTI